MLNPAKFLVGNKLIAAGLLLMLFNISGCMANLLPFAQNVKIQEQLQNQAVQARQSEAKSTLTAMIRAQLAYVLENSSFASTMEEMEINLPTETENYTYRIVPQQGQTSVMMNAQAKRPGLKSYTGAVLLARINGNTTIPSGICETDAASTTPPVPTLTGGSTQIQCPPGSHLTTQISN